MQKNNSLKISIVDDDALMRVMLEDFFNGHYEHAALNFYSTGEEALSNISSVPDLAILDYNLDSSDNGGMNGIQLLKKLNEKFPGIPVIFLSGQENATIAANTLKNGARDYIIKNEKLFSRLEDSLVTIIGKSEERKANAVQKKSLNVILIVIISFLLGIFIWRFMR